MNRFLTFFLLLFGAQAIAATEGSNCNQKLELETLYSHAKVADAEQHLLIDTSYFPINSGGSWRMSSIPGWRLGGGNHAGGLWAMQFRVPDVRGFKIAFLFFSDLLRKGALKQLASSHVGIALHIDEYVENALSKPKVFWIFSCANIEKNKSETLTAYRNIPTDYINKVLADYRIRPGISEEHLELLRKASIQTLERAHVFVVSNQSFMLNKGKATVYLRDHFPPSNYDFEPFLPEELKPMPEHLPIIAGAIAVTSQSDSELLTMEVYNSIKIQRRHPDEVLIEIGRYKSDLPEITPKLVQEIAAAIHGSIPGNRPSRVLIEADEARARVFSRYGFKKIIERSSTYDQRKEYILEVDTEEFLRKAIESDKTFEEFFKPY